MADEVKEDPLLKLARKAIAAMDARTTPVAGDPCPCGRGPATVGGGAGLPERFHCAACEKDSRAATLRFLMDDSFGGP